jgi:hypothetical protein
LKTRKTYQKRENSLWRAFNAFDKNDNGLLEPQEFLMLCWRIGLPLKESQLNDVYDSLGPSKDGGVCYDEFVGWLNDPSKARKLKQQISKGMMQSLTSVKGYSTFKSCESRPHMEPFWFIFADPAIESFHRQYEAANELPVRRLMYNLLLLVLFVVYPLLGQFGDEDSAELKRDLLVIRFLFLPPFLLGWVALNCRCCQVTESYLVHQFIIFVAFIATVWHINLIQSFRNPALLIPVFSLMLGTLVMRPCMLVACLALPHAVAAGLVLDFSFGTAVPAENIAYHAGEYTVAALLTLMACYEMEADYREKTSLLMRREIDMGESKLSTEEIGKRMHRMSAIHTFRLVEAEFICRNTNDMESAVTERLDSSEANREMPWSALFFGSYSFADNFDESAFQEFARQDSLKHFQRTLPQLLAIECVMTGFAVYPTVDAVELVSIWGVLAPLWSAIWLLSRVEGNFVQQHPAFCFCFCFLIFAGIVLVSHYWFLEPQGAGNPMLERLALNEGLFEIILLTFIAFADLGLSGPQAWGLATTTHIIHQACHWYSR